MSSVKEEATKLIDRLPDQITWDDIMYEFCVKKKIATGIKRQKKVTLSLTTKSRRDFFRNEDRFDLNRGTFSNRANLVLPPKAKIRNTNGNQGQKKRKIEEPRYII